MEINCSYNDLVEIGTLVPHPRNPNKHSDHQIRLLAKIMEHQGWRNPIVVSGRSGFITKGHGRLAAAQLNEWTHVPIDRQPYKNEADEWADMVADNRIAELADPDETMLRDLMRDLGDDFDMELLGFDEKALKELGDQETTVPDLPTDTLGEGMTYSVIVECANEQEQADLLTELELRGLKCKLMVV